MSEEERKIIARLTFARKSAGLSYRQVAEKAGVPHSCVNYWEKGERSPSIGNLIKWASAFDINVVLRG